MPTNADTGDHDGHQRTTIFCLECWLEIWKYNMDSCCLNKQSYALPLWRSNISLATLPVSWPPAMKIQVFHWLPIQSVDLLLWRSSISLATPPVSSSPAMKIKYFTGYPSRQLISCYEDQIFHWVPLQSVHLQCKSTTLLTVLCNHWSPAARLHFGKEGGVRAVVQTK